jgi:hypothetical protein
MGVYWPLQRVGLLVVCTWICVVWRVELGMSREVWWSRCGCLFCLNENGALACSPWIDETVGFNTCAVLTLSLTEPLAVVIVSLV